MKIACAYIRVSTDHQLEYSPSSQLKLIKEYALKNDLLLDENLIYKDEGISGRKANKRPQFQQMILDSKKNKFQVILIYNTSRFARNHEESIIYRAMLKKEGIEVISITQPNTDPKTDILMNALYAVIDERYSIDLSENVFRGMKEKATRGGFLGSPPYGYKIQTPKSAPVIDKKKAQIVKFIFDKFTEENMSSYNIAKLLNYMAIRTSRNNKWEKRTIEYILKNEFYTGKYIWNKRNSITNTVNEKEKWIITEGSHKKIISEKQFKKAQNIFLKNKNNNRKVFNNKKHWLSGLIKCSNCGNTLSSTKIKDKVYFQCTSYNKGKCNISHFISENKIKKYLYESLEKTINIKLHNNNIFSNIIFKKNISSFSKENNKNIKKQISLCNKKLKRIYESYINNIDTLEEYKINKKKIISELDFLNKEILYKNTEKNNIKNLNDIYNLLISENTDYEIKHNIIKSLVKKIVFYKKINLIEIFYYS